ncbi:Bll0177 protein [hydrothermal vent metagenome]|uniref:Bll0177 protein n=1 Tax=hydrothermal vent metagenome TaxID=652676 RepID=A0A1W1CCD7_9ZZZZ
MRYFFLYCIATLFIYAGVFATDILPSPQFKRFMGIKILDQKQLSFSNIKGVVFSELSDVTYDTKTQTLYFVSDKGLLYLFNAHFSNKIDKLNPLDAVKLKTKKGKRLKKWKRDSEGLTLDGHHRLLISFEGNAQIAWFHKNSSNMGKRIRNYSLPKRLRDVKNYRSPNKSLESLAWHPHYGVLTAAEWPLKKDYKKKQTIYALSGKKWHFKAEPEGRSGISAIEVMDDGNVLVLERSYTGLFEPFIVTLKKVYLNQCKRGWCKTKILLKMNNHKGWQIDNFEGLAKVGKNRYIMVSDDNDNFFQRTLLVYFEVIDE